jgi:hypothetical protein
MSRYQRARWKGWAAGSRRDLHGYSDADGVWHPPDAPEMPRPTGRAKQDRRRKLKEPGIRPEQAKELAALQRVAGVPWSGNGMRAREAEREIARLRQLLDL